MAYTHDPTASYALILNELEKRTFTIRTYTVAGQNYVEYSHPNGAVWLTRTKHFSYPINHGAVMEMADNKTQAYDWVRQFDIAVADFVTISPSQSLADVKDQDFFSQGKKVVVKPESGSASHGLSMNIDSNEKLQDAVKVARTTEQFSNNVIIQEQVEGEELRFAVLGGKVVAVIQRQPMCIMGDGQKTIATLVTEENNAREIINRNSMVPYPKVEDAQTYFPKLDYVPGEGEAVKLAESTMISGGASIWNVTHQVDKSYIEFIEMIIAKLGAEFLVVDLFIADYRKPLDARTTYFNEFNKAPALKMFYSSRDGNNCDIVPMLADAIEKRLGNN